MKAMAERFQKLGVVPVVVLENEKMPYHWPKRWYRAVFRALRLHSVQKLQQKVFS